jgi:hypothetical protein
VVEAGQQRLSRREHRTGARLHPFMPVRSSETFCISKACPNRTQLIRGVGLRACMHSVLRHTVGWAPTTSQCLMRSKLSVMSFSP